MYHSAASAAPGAAAAFVLLAERFATAELSGTSEGVAVGPCLAETPTVCRTDH